MNGTCFRTERGNCRICWTAEVDSDFAVSFSMAANNASKKNCCGYGDDGRKRSGFDCVVIPGALTASKNTIPGAQMVCGRSRGLGSASAGPKTICCKFQIYAFCKLLNNQFIILQLTANLLRYASCLILGRRLQNQ